MTTAQPVARAGLRLDGVGKRFGRRTVLTDVDLDLPAGTFVEVRGTNSSGKSTLLRIMAAVSSPTSGRVSQPGPRVAYVPDGGPLGQGMTVAGHLRAMGRLGPHPDDGSRTAALVERYGLGSHLATAMSALSKGTAKKVAIVQALLDPADLLVLDEPTDGLDTDATARLREDLAAATGHGAVVVVACHDDSLDAVPGRRVRVADGRTVASAVTHEIVWYHVDLVSSSGITARHQVPEDALDALLLQTLRDGGSVRRVEPA